MPADTLTGIGQYNDTAVTDIDSEYGRSGQGGILTSINVKECSPRYPANSTATRPHYSFGDSYQRITEP